MTRTRWIWSVLVAVWLVFFGWYTSCGGPLTEDEIEHWQSGGEFPDPWPDSFVTRRH